MPKIEIDAGKMKAAVSAAAKTTGLPVKPSGCCGGSSDVTTKHIDTIASGLVQLFQDHGMTVGQKAASDVLNSMFKPTHGQPKAYNGVESIFKDATVRLSATLESQNVEQTAPLNTQTGANNVAPTSPQDLSKSQKVVEHQNGAPLQQEQPVACTQPAPSNINNANAAASVAQAATSQLAATQQAMQQPEVQDTSKTATIQQQNYGDVNLVSVAPTGVSTLGNQTLEVQEWMDA